ncbi:asparagine synthetase domain-containing protein [Phanerochaete sordida]|uniref:Asparagine synthetase domain-containing protein n=1 Tax=Phanerochaete sordida TaxID=48140 RepID=A0A9P3L8C8_9APHY|nr:asparagine synthetase domain-containing protein [Phanerochaete sordida]
MCGILFCLQTTVQHHSDAAWNDVFHRLKNASVARGLDAQETVVQNICGLSLTYFASELRLRGDAYIAQPHRDEQGNILCWNGEIFEGLEVSADENDGAKLFAELRRTETPEQIQDLLGDLEGPYAFVYYSASMRKLFFGRDPLGRRSLLIHKPTAASPRLVLASVSVGPSSEYSLDELPTDTFFFVDLPSLEGEDIIDGLTSYFHTLRREDTAKALPFAHLTPVNRTLPSDPPASGDLDNPEEHLTAAADRLLKHLDESVRLRVVNIPQKLEDQGKARVAVLFSGGIDSTVLAFLADRHVDRDEPIDLLNVAFENPRKILVQAEGNIGGLPKWEKKQKLKDRTQYTTIEVTYNVPDRGTGLQELEELRRLCPHRTWNFVEVNVPFEEYTGARTIVENLMFPGRTVMDLSLAAALYFAARGEGQVRDDATAEARPYKSPARVLLNGLGSDELLGGYGRFRTAYKAAGWQAIIDELQLELDRIPTRNLGRDDRVISSHGKETRHPFLSLSVVSFLSSLPVHMKLDPRLEAGIGEKMLLRIAARKVGLVEASSRKKRAMQFGSHSARMAPGDGDKKGDIILPDA